MTLPACNGTTSQPLSLLEWGFSLMRTTFSASQQSQNSWAAFTTMTLARTGKPGKLPVNFNNAVIGVALLIGTVTDHLIFSWIADKLGRKRTYSFTLVVTVICTICSGLSVGASKETVIETLCFFRFWLGLVSMETIPSL